LFDAEALWLVGHEWVAAWEAGVPNRKTTAKNTAATVQITLLCLRKYIIGLPLHDERYRMQVCRP
jgi:hypothetical protein